MNRRTFVLGLGAGAALSALPAAAWAQPSVADALRDVAKERATLKNLVATFTQERTMGLLSSTVTSKGEMVLVPPDRLRWELKPPDAVTYWVTKTGLILQDKNGAKSVPKAHAGAFSAVLSDLLVLLGGDLSTLRARYDFSVISRDASGLALLAKPLAPEVKKSVARLEMHAGPELWRVKQVTIEEPSGDTSVIKFDAASVQRDKELDPKKVTPPKT